MTAETYRIQRFYQNDRRTRTIKTGLSLQQAQEHCTDPETSSKTASNACNGNEKTIARWEEKGKHWFDGYDS